MMTTRGRQSGLAALALAAVTLGGCGADCDEYADRVCSRACICVEQHDACIIAYADAYTEVGQNMDECVQVLNAQCERADDPDIEACTDIVDAASCLTQPTPGVSDAVQLPAECDFRGSR